MDKTKVVEYWNRYYHKEIQQPPSPFATFFAKNYLKPHHVLFEAGFGSGRDSLFFSSLVKQVIGVDISDEAVKLIDKLTTKNGINKDNIIVSKNDFTHLKVEDFKKFGINVVYSRWTLHTVPEDGEERFIKFVSELLEKDGLFAIECRTIKDSLNGKGTRVSDNEWIYTHYRRFLDRNVVEEKLRKLGFDIIFSVEDYGFSKVNDDDPHLMRIIAKKL